MTTQFIVSKERRWFCVEGPDGIEIEDASHRTLAAMMTNNIDIMDAHHNGNLKFNEEKISFLEKEEILSIINQEAIEEQLEYLGLDDEN